MPKLARMSGRPRLYFSDALLAYDFGPGHPMAPHRVRLTLELAAELAVLDRIDVVEPSVPHEEMLLTVHTAPYVAAVKAAGADPDRADERFGLGTPDNPAFRGMHESSLAIAGASVDAALAIERGEVLHALNLMGGLHHAMPSHASGFCIYNDVALAIRALLDAGAERIVYVDTDAHHGDGVEAVFANDRRVLTISLHESPISLFPGTGWIADIGGPAAPGSAVNVPLPAGTSDAAWWRAFSAVVPPLVRAFAPTVLVTQHGADGHGLDPLTNLDLSVDVQRAAAVVLHDLAHEVAGGRWLVLGGGGYATVDVVPRAWTHLVAIASGHPVAPETATPTRWRDLIRDEFGRSAPTAMTDGRQDAMSAIGAFSDAYDPSDPVDQTILQVQHAVFPYHGIAVDW
jgi:acetoin utilization protein AcuC